MMKRAVNPDWSHKKLNELGFVGRGKSRHRPRNDSSLYGGTYPFIQTGDVKAANFYISEYSQTYNEKGLSQSKLWEPNTLCITIAANIAETAILKIKACFPDSIVGFIANQKEADVRFIKYYIDTIKLSMQNVSKGTTQDNLSLDKLLIFDFITPPLPTQRKIAAILSTYDNLIENNTRRIKILEEMAQALYREWFVEFKFPGYEKVNLVDSEFGRIPENWEWKKYSDIIESKTGGGWGKEHPTKKEFSKVIVIRGTDFKEIHNGTELRSPKRYISSQSLEKRKLTDGDIIVENSVNAKSRCVGLTTLITPGILQRLNCDSIAASFCKVFRLRDKKLAPIVFLHMRHLYATEDMAFYQNVATNGIGNFQATRFIEREKIPVPKDWKILESMCSFLNNLTSSISADKNFNLRRTRDLLLPKLISGELDVNDLPIDERI